MLRIFDEAMVGLTKLLKTKEGFHPWLMNGGERGTKYDFSDDYSKITRRENGELMLEPCEKSEDERILIVTAQRKDFGEAKWRIRAADAEILRMDDEHTDTLQLIARMTEPDGCIMICGQTFSFQRGRGDVPDIALELQKCRELHLAEEEALRNREEILPELIEANKDFRSVCWTDCELCEGPYFRWVNRRWLYNVASLAEVRSTAERAREERRMFDANQEFSPLFYQVLQMSPKMASRGTDLCHGYVRMFTNVVQIVIDGVSHDYEYSSKGLLEFMVDIQKFEAGLK